MNTQAPPADWWAGLTPRIFDDPISCAAPDVAPTISTLRGHPVPFYVSYPEVSEELRHRSGVEGTVMLNESRAVTIHWYFEYRAHSSSRVMDVPAAAANMIINATIVAREPDGETTIVATGQTDSLALAGPLAASLNQGKKGFEGVSQSPEGAYVYGIALDVQPQVRTFGDFDIWINASIRDPICDENGSFVGEMVPYTDEEHRPRLRLQVMNPLSVSNVSAYHTEAGLRVHLHPESPWGMYNIGDVTMRAVSVNGAQNVSTACSSIDLCVLENKALDRGARISVDVTDLQQRAHVRIAFSLDHPERSVPAVPMVFLLVLAAMVGTLQSIRQRPS